MLALVTMLLGVTAALSALSAQSAAPAAPLSAGPAGPAGPAGAGEDIRAAKPLVELPQPKRTPVALWAGITGGVVLLAIAAVLWRRHARRRRLKSPAELALMSLTELAASRETIAAEAFANRAAETIRQYVAARFGLAAPRRTTEEFLLDLTTSEDSPLRGQSDHLRGFLKACDLAKFAGWHLDATQRGELLQTARGFITATATATATAAAAAKPRVIPP